MDLLKPFMAHVLTKIVSPPVIPTNCRMVQAKVDVYAQIYMYFSRRSRYPVAGFSERERRLLKHRFSMSIDFFSEDFDHRITKKELEKAQ